MSESFEEYKPPDFNDDLDVDFNDYNEVPQTTPKEDTDIKVKFEDEDNPFEIVYADGDFMMVGINDIDNLEGIIKLIHRINEWDEQDTDPGLNNINITSSGTMELTGNDHFYTNPLSNSNKAERMKFMTECLNKRLADFKQYYDIQKQEGSTFSQLESMGKQDELLSQMEPITFFQAKFQKYTDLSDSWKKSDIKQEISKGKKYEKDDEKINGGIMKEFTGEDYIYAHTHIPKPELCAPGIKYYSYKLYPEDYQPSGTANTSGLSFHDLYPSKYNQIKDNIQNSKSECHFTPSKVQSYDIMKLLLNDPNFKHTYGAPLTTYEKLQQKLNEHIDSVDDSDDDLPPLEKVPSPYDSRIDEVD